jgi:ketosteroid isomerase-like protein
MLFAVMHQWEEMRETWHSDTLEPISDFIHAADRVAVRYVWHGVGRGPESNIELTSVFTLRKGKVTDQEFFWDHMEALETVGLSE